MTTNNSQQRLLTLAGAVIAALIMIIAYLLYNNSKQNSTIDSQATQLNESEQLTSDLEKQYSEAIAELEEMRGSNEQLNALIDEQKKELSAQKDKISDLIGSKKNLSAAREEMKNMKSKMEGYLAEINSLKEANQMLTNQNMELSDQNQNLNTDLSSARVKNDELSSAKAALTSEKGKLEQDNQKLNSTVNLASVIKVKDISASAYKIKDSGKQSKKRYAKNVDAVDLCFSTTVNEVAKKGREIFYIRIINPLGETLAIEEVGSGVMINNRNNEQIRYTSTKEHDYVNEENKVCFTWNSETAFQKGEYTVEVYNKGYLAGTGGFRLK